MKLSPRDAPRYFARPDPEATGLLIYGPDAMRVALKRQEVIAALIGPEGEAEMRLTRMQGGDLRKDPAQLIDAIKAQGFFPGPRVAFVEEANETAAPAILTALEDWRPGDAQIVITAGQLKPTSKIRKAFEGHRSAYCAAIYDNPPTQEEIEADLKRAGLKSLPPEALRDLSDLAKTLDPGDFRQTLEKLALYKFRDDTPVTAQDIAEVAPRSIEAALDDALDVVAEGRARDLGMVLRRLQGQGVVPVTLCIGAMRHFRTLYTVSSAPGGPQEGIGRLRPPVFGPRRDKVLRQAQGWDPQRLEQAITLLTDTDLALRSAGQSAPQQALVERALIRLSMLARR